MDFIFQETWFTMLDRRSPAYGSHLMKLMITKWAEAKNGANLVDGLTLTSHKPKRLRIKDHIPPMERPKLKGKLVDPATTSSTSMGSSDDSPGWFTRFATMFKSSLCFPNDRLYDAYD